MKGRLIRFGAYLPDVLAEGFTGRGRTFRCTLKQLIFLAMDLVIINVTRSASTRVGNIICCSPSHVVPADLFLVHLSSTWPVRMS